MPPDTGYLPPGPLAHRNHAQGPHASTAANGRASNRSQHRTALAGPSSLPPNARATPHVPRAAPNHLACTPLASRTRLSMRRPADPEPPPIRERPAAPNHRLPTSTAARSPRPAQPPSVARVSSSARAHAQRSRSRPRPIRSRSTPPALGAPAAPAAATLQAPRHRPRDASSSPAAIPPARAPRSLRRDPHRIPVTLFETQPLHAAHHRSHGSAPRPPLPCRCTPPGASRSRTARAPRGRGDLPERGHADPPLPTRPAEPVPPSWRPSRRTTTHTPTRPCTPPANSPRKPAQRRVAPYATRPRAPKPSRPPRADLPA